MAGYRMVKKNHEKQKKIQNKEIYKNIKSADKKKKEERISYLEMISDHMLLPADIVAGAPYITLSGRTSICVENHKKIMEYNEEKIKIQAKPSPICVEGKELKIEYYSQDELKITGIIKSISYQ